jgi:hypothetical protein
MLHRTHYLGKAGEYAVASQLLLRGVSVSFPAVDDGADLYAGHLRIQVKSARKIRVRRAGSWGYHFNIGVHKWNPKKRQHFHVEARNRVDFFVFWGIDENRFWIVPAPLLSKTAVRIVEGSRRYSVSGDDIRALLGTGLTQRAIAERLGVSEMSVSRIANGLLPLTVPGSCYEVAQREDAWHEIISALGLVNSIEQETKLEEQECHK